MFNNRTGGIIGGLTSTTQPDHSSEPIDPKTLVSLPIVCAQIGTTLLLVAATLCKIITVDTEDFLMEVAVPLLICVLSGMAALLGFIAVSNTTWKWVMYYLKFLMIPVFIFVSYIGYSFAGPTDTEKYPFASLTDREISPEASPTDSDISPEASPILLIVYEFSIAFYIIAAVPNVVGLIYGYRRGNPQHLMPMTEQQREAINREQGTNLQMDASTGSIQSAQAQQYTQGVYPSLDTTFGPAPQTAQDPYGTDYGPPPEYGFK